MDNPLPGFDLCFDCQDKVAQWFATRLVESRELAVTTADETWGKAHGLWVSYRPIPKPVTSAPCPVCAHPIRSDETEGLFSCERCKGVYHAPCYWRVLPMEDFLTYWRWLQGWNPDYENDRHPPYVCASCKEGA